MENEAAKPGPPAEQAGGTVGRSPLTAQQQQRNKTEAAPIASPQKVSPKRQKDVKFPDVVEKNFSTNKPLTSTKRGIGVRLDSDSSSSAKSGKKIAASPALKHEADLGTKPRQEPGSTTAVQGQGVTDGALTRQGNAVVTVELGVDGQSNCKCSCGCSACSCGSGASDQAEQDLLLKLDDLELQLTARVTNLKTDDGKRLVELCPGLVDVLEEYVAKLEKAKLQAGFKNYSGRTKRSRTAFLPKTSSEERMENVLMDCLSLLARDSPEPERKASRRSERGRARSPIKKKDLDSVKRTTKRVSK